MNVEFDLALTGRFGSVDRAAALGIEASRLRRFISGELLATAQERRCLAAALGVDYFASDGNPVRF